MLQLYILDTRARSQLPKLTLQYKLEYKSWLFGRKGFSNSIEISQKSLLLWTKRKINLSGVFISSACQNWNKKSLAKVFQNLQSLFQKNHIIKPSRIKKVSNFVRSPPRIWTQDYWDICMLNACTLNHNSPLFN